MYVITEPKEHCKNLIDFGSNLFDFENPIATYKDFLICFRDEFFLNNKQLFALYKGKKFIDYFTTLGEAKEYVKNNY